MSLVPVCMICGRCTSTYDPLLQCSKCHIIVHQYCYGVSVVSQPWLCYSCRKGCSAQPTCCICNTQFYSPFTPVSDTMFAHTICLLAHPGCGFYLDQSKLVLHSPFFFFPTLHNGKLMHICLNPASLPYCDALLPLAQDASKLPCKIPSSLGIVRDVAKSPGMHFCDICKQPIQSFGLRCGVHTCNCQFHMHCWIMHWNSFFYEVVFFKQSYRIVVICNRAHTSLQHHTLSHHFPQFYQIHLSPFSSLLSPFDLSLLCIAPHVLQNPQSISQSAALQLCLQSYHFFHRLSPSQKRFLTHQAASFSFYSTDTLSTLLHILDVVKRALTANQPIGKTPPQKRVISRGNSTELQAFWARVDELYNADEEALRVAEAGVEAAMEKVEEGV
ncbi:hypothetical protein WA556_006687, partial [Blastocystis sp. ATCC 50177/Nand II]